jgi:hypothetical protein
LRRFAQKEAEVRAQQAAAEQPIAVPKPTDADTGIKN